MKPSTFTVSDHIEAIRMFTTFYMYEDPRSKSFLENALPACAAAKYISDNWDHIYPSLSENEADDLPPTSPEDNNMEDPLLIEDKSGSFGSENSFRRVKSVADTLSTKERFRFITSLFSNACYFSFLGLLPQCCNWMPLVSAYR